MDPVVDGQVTTSTFADYKIPACSDVPITAEKSMGSSTALVSCCCRSPGLTEIDTTNELARKAVHVLGEKPER